MAADGDGDLTVTVLRELFRNLVSWRSAYEASGLDEITDGGVTWSLWDVERLFDQRVHLPPRQREAIELCLEGNVLEREAAKQMGVSETNPVASYATDGLKNIIAMVRSGLVSGYRVTAA